MTQFPDEQSGRQRPFGPGEKSGGQYTGGSSSSSSSGSGSNAGQGPYTPGSSSSERGQQYSATGSSSDREGVQYTGGPGQRNSGPYNASSERGAYAATRTDSGSAAYGESGSGSGISIANPTVLGVVILGLALVLLGCYYAGFILTSGPIVRMAVGTILLFGGIAQVLAGMWGFRRNSDMTGTIFTAIGAFLAAIGFLFMPTGILLPLDVAGTGFLVLGLFFLCGAILAAVLWLGIMRENSLLSFTTILLALAFLLLGIGHLAFNNAILLGIGGWIAIICGLFAWASAALQLLGKFDLQENLTESRETRQPAVAAD